MNLKKYLPILETGILSFLVYAFHKLFLYFNQNSANFHVSIELVYSFFFVCSVLISFVLIKVKKKDIDNVGFTFIGLTCIKMGLAYGFYTYISNFGNSNLGFEKGNFLIVFSFFLTIETIIAVRILNNNQ